MDQIRREQQGFEFFGLHLFSPSHKGGAVATEEVEVAIVVEVAVVVSEVEGRGESSVGVT
jgi:hypothetical protein